HRLIDRIRRLAQLRTMRRSLDLADLAIFTVLPEKISWIPAHGGRLAKLAFLPVGPNLPVSAAGDPSLASANLETGGKDARPHPLPSSPSPAAKPAPAKPAKSSPPSASPPKNWESSASPSSAVTPNSAKPLFAKACAISPWNFPWKGFWKERKSSKGFPPATRYSSSAARFPPAAPAPSPASPADFRSSPIPARRPPRPSPKPASSSSPSI